MKFILWLQKAVASLLFLGYIPLLPGTVGSAVVVVGLWFLQFRTHIVLSPHQWWVAVIGLTAFSIIVSSRPREVFGREDPPQVIIDECAGQLLTFFLVPLSLNTLLIGFALFRFFDIVKPFPIYKLEDAEGGVGITMDDIAAGVFANISLLIILHGYQFIKAAL
jgi:phosphatidylglycerophosphatase A